MRTILFFDCLRFSIEQFIAVYLIAKLFGEKERAYSPRFVISCIGYLLFSFLYPILIEFHGSSLNVGRVITIACYVLICISSCLAMKLRFELSFADSLFLGVAGYILQHIDFILVNELLALGVWPSLRSNLLLYSIVCIAGTILIYGVFLLFAKGRVPRATGSIFQDSPRTIFSMTLVLTLILILTFTCQIVFVNGVNNNNVQYSGALIDILVCIVIMWCQYVICELTFIKKEKEVLRQLLHTQKHQYELSKEQINIINTKCHNLRHQIHALKHVDSNERNEYIKELEKSIEIYDSALRTGNEAVDTVLSEKKLACDSQGIHLSCIVDGSALSFMRTMDIYALLGNALENAMEAAQKLTNPELRSISFSIKRNMRFVSIQIENYCDHPLQLVNGLPQTTKKNTAYHGIGMKSMQHIAESYGGSLVVSTEGDVFVLQIVLPIPE